MALLTYRPPVNYTEQQGENASRIQCDKTLTRPTAAFQDFLRSYKTTEATLDDLNLDDGTSDEYDFMDDAEGANANGNGNQRQRRQDRHTKLKYMDQLRRIADRKQAHITVELDDLQAVRCIIRLELRTTALTGYSTKKRWTTQI